MSTKTATNRIIGVFTDRIGEREYSHAQIREAQQVARTYMVEPRIDRFLCFNDDPKTIKSNRAGANILTAIQYFAPARVSGYNVCASASVGCTIGCLHTAGMPFRLQAKNRARIAKTRFFREQSESYNAMLWAGVAYHVDRCDRETMLSAVRPNGTSDVVWERIAPWLFTTFPGTQFYDYTKHTRRMLRGYGLPDNYDLTFSRSETNESDCLRILADNPAARVAVVFSTSRYRELPKTWHGRRVFDADQDDLRFLDRERHPGRRIAGLRAKGRARRDSSGFVVQVPLGRIM